MLRLIMSAFLFCAFNLQGQNWSHYVSMEENFHYTDQPRLDGNFSLGHLATNAGMRFGTRYSNDKILSGEITVGVIGIGTPNVFSSKIVPLEILGNYRLINGEQANMTIDFGVGSGLGEAAKQTFGLSEHIVLGTSLHFTNAIPSATLILGSRFTYFLDDYLDNGGLPNGNGLNEGKYGDAALRLFLGLQFDGVLRAEKKAKEEAKKLSNSLILAEQENLYIKNDSKKVIEELNDEVDKLNDEIKTLKSILAETSYQEFEFTDTIVQNNSQENSLNTNIDESTYNIIIGSFKSKVAALAFIKDNDLNGEIHYIKELDMYRVVRSKRSLIDDTGDERKESISISKNANLIIITVY